jgi:hypothetical protein
MAEIVGVQNGVIPEDSKERIENMERMSKQDGQSRRPSTVAGEQGKVFNTVNPTIYNTTQNSPKRVGFGPLDYKKNQQFGQRRESTPSRFVDGD